MKTRKRAPAPSFESIAVDQLDTVLGGCACGCGQEACNCANGSCGQGGAAPRQQMTWAR